MTQIREGGVEIPAGMKMWLGGDSAPADWDGGEVQWLERAGHTRVGLKQPEQPWAHGAKSWFDIIAYTPTPSPELAEQPMREKLLRHALLKIARMMPGVYCSDECSYEFLAMLPDELAHYELTRAIPTDPFTTARNDIAGLPGHGMSADVQVAERRVDLWRDEIGKLVEAGFATVSRNPSDHEVVLAYRAAIHLALATSAPDAAKRENRT